MSDCKHKWVGSAFDPIQCACCGMMLTAWQARRIRELEQRLAAVWGLPDKWLNSAGADHADTHILSDNGFMTIIECADELRAALHPKEGEW